MAKLTKKKSGKKTKRRTGNKVRSDINAFTFRQNGIDYNLNGLHHINWYLNIGVDGDTILDCFNLQNATLFKEWLDTLPFLVNNTINPCDLGGSIFMFFVQDGVPKRPRRCGRNGHFMC